MCALDADAQCGLEGSATIPVIQFKLSERENKVLSNVSSFFGLVTAGNRAGATSLPKPTSALRMMTNGNDMCFWGPIGINFQVSRFHSGGRRGAPHAHRKAGRGDSSAAESPRQPGRRRVRNIPSYIWVFCTI